MKYDEKTLTVFRLKLVCPFCNLTQEYYWVVFHIDNQNNDHYSEEAFVQQDQIFSDVNQVMSLVDFNDNGLLDVIVSADFEGDNVFLLKNIGDVKYIQETMDGNFEEIINNILVIDLDKDGDLDILFEGDQKKCGISSRKQSPIS